MSKEDKDRLSPIRRFFKEHKEAPFISHEREELIEKLAQSDNPKLRQIGQLEAEFMKMKLVASHR